MPRLTENMSQIHLCSALKRPPESKKGLWGGLDDSQILPFGNGEGKIASDKEI
jgi:hypothetical protein